MKIQIQMSLVQTVYDGDKFDKPFKSYLGEDAV